MSVFEGKTLLKQDKSEVDAAEVVGNAQVVAVYFSAHWCPPCRGFTPMLKEFWEDNKDKGLVIIFVSSDRSEPDMISYFAEHGDYYAVKFGDELVTTLKTNCGVSGIPCLAIVGKDGKMVYKEGRNDVAADPDGAVELWKSKC